MGDVVSLLHRKMSQGKHLGFRRGPSLATAAEWYARGCELERTGPGAGGDRAAAIQAYRRAVAGDVQHASAHNNLGRLLHEAGDLDGAERSYRLAIAAAVGRGVDDLGASVFWFNLGVVLEDRGRTEDAVTAYRAAVARNEQLADAHFNLARLLERAGDVVSARAAIRHLAAYRALIRRVG